MRQLTIAEWRQKEVETLHARNTAVSIEDARKALNSYYRLCAFSERIFYINNDEALYTRYTRRGRLEAMEARETAWIKRLNNYLMPCGGCVAYTGLYPSIVVKGDNGCIENTVIYGHFYN